MLSISPNPILAPRPAQRPGQTVAGVEQDLLRKPHLAHDRRHVAQEHRRDLRDMRQAKTAAEAIGAIPGPGEAVHVVISGKFALGDMLPAILDMGKSRIERLHIATLGFSKRNISKLCELIDAQQIGEASLLCSHYFKGTSATIYDFAVQEFASRPRIKFLSVRTHAKLVLIALADGRRVTFESSANLRSCKNIEQCSLFGDPKLYDFHREWIDELFQRAEL